MSGHRWSADDVGDLQGKTAVITGGTRGLGLHVALSLATRGAQVIATTRNPGKAQATLDRLRRAAPGRPIDLLRLDLADLGQTEQAARQLLEATDRIQILVDNAGIMIPPFTTTADGYELQMGTNHLGHFAWTAGLWPALREGARIVTVSSLAHTGVRSIDLRTLTRAGSPRRYRRWRAYAESKLANLSFAFELDRRVQAVGLDVVSVAAHPGYAATELFRNGLGLHGTSLPAIAAHQIGRIFAQPPAQGSLPLLRAAGDPTLTGGEYLGPDGPGQLRGAHPRVVDASPHARDPALAEQLWRASEDAIGRTFDVR